MKSYNNQEITYDSEIYPGNLNGENQQTLGVLLYWTQNTQIDIEEVHNEFGYKHMNLEDQIPRSTAATTVASWKMCPQQNTLMLDFSTQTLSVTEHCTLCLAPWRMLSQLSALLCSSLKVEKRHPALKTCPSCTAASSLLRGTTQLFCYQSDSDWSL